MKNSFCSYLLDPAALNWYRCCRLCSLAVRLVKGMVSRMFVIINPLIGQPRQGFLCHSSASRRLSLTSTSSSKNHISKLTIQQKTPQEGVRPPPRPSGSLSTQWQAHIPPRYYLSSASALLVHHLRLSGHQRQRLSTASAHNVAALVTPDRSQSHRDQDLVRKGC